MQKCPYEMVNEAGRRFVPQVFPLRDGLPVPPELMSHLPKDARGYPVPFFVAWPKDEPEFRASSRQVIDLCVNRNLCWVCGRPLEGQQMFVIGPMCTVNRISSEPPSHRDCARYSAAACPFLSKPWMVRRENDLPDGITDGAGVSLRHNPGVTALWFGQGFDVLEYPQGRLWHFNRKPLAVEWYCESRRATRGEVEAAIERGLPKLREVAESDGTLKYLNGWLDRARQLLPKAVAA